MVWSVRLAAGGALLIVAFMTLSAVTGDHTLGSVTYAQVPPHSGDHSPVWQKCGFYVETVDNRHAVHTLEHGAVWHEAGGWAMRSVLGEPKAIVPAVKAVGAAGYRVMVPLHYIHACYVRSHFTGIEVGIQDAPRPKEILFALAMGTGGRIHSRLGGLTKEQVSVHDGQR